MDLMLSNSSTFTPFLRMLALDPHSDYLDQDDEAELTQHMVSGAA